MFFVGKSGAKYVFAFFLGENHRKMVYHGLPLYMVDWILLDRFWLRLHRIFWSPPLGSECHGFIGLFIEIILGYWDEKWENSIGYSKDIQRILVDLASGVLQRGWNIPWSYMEVMELHAWEND